MKPAAGLLREARYIVPAGSSTVTLSSHSWPSALAVELSTQPTVCSLCLSDSPRPPIITQCGHVYCLCCWLTFVRSSHQSTSPTPPVTPTAARAGSGGGSGGGGGSPQPQPPVLQPAALRASVPCPVCGAWVVAGDYRHVRSRGPAGAPSAARPAGRPSTAAQFHALPTLDALLAAAGKAAVSLPPAAAPYAASMGGRCAAYTCAASSQPLGWLAFRLVALASSAGPAAGSAALPYLHSPVVLHSEQPPLAGSEGAAYAFQCALGSPAYLCSLHQAVLADLEALAADNAAEAAEATAKVQAIIAAVAEGSKGRGKAGSVSTAKGAWAPKSRPSPAGGGAASALSAAAAAVPVSGAWGDRSKVHMLVKDMKGGAGSSGGNPAAEAPAASAGYRPPPMPDHATAEECETLGHWADVCSSYDTANAIVQWAREASLKELARLAASSEGSAGGAAAAAAATAAAAADSAPPTYTHCIYQAAVGVSEAGLPLPGAAAEPVYLHPLCQRILLDMAAAQSTAAAAAAAAAATTAAPAGSAAQPQWSPALFGLPAYLAAPVTAVEAHSVHSELLRRQPFFAAQHASAAGARVRFVEVDLARALCHSPPSFPANALLSLATEGLRSAGALPAAAEYAKRVSRRKGALGAALKGGGGAAGGSSSSGGGGGGGGGTQPHSGTASTSSSRKHSAGDAGEGGGSSSSSASGSGGGGGGGASSGSGSAQQQQQPPPSQSQLLRDIMGITHFDEQEWGRGVAGCASEEWEWGVGDACATPSNATRYFPSLGGGGGSGSGSSSGGGGSGSGRGSGGSSSSSSSSSSQAAAAAQQAPGQWSSFRDIAGQRAVTASQFPGLGDLAGGAGKKKGGK